jgi:hypothetical protein
MAQTTQAIRLVFGGCDIPGCVTSSCQYTSEISAHARISNQNMCVVSRLTCHDNTDDSDARDPGSFIEMKSYNSTENRTLGLVPKNPNSTPLVRF